MSIRCRCGRPRPSQCCTAIFIATSTATEPESLKKTWSSPGGVIADELLGELDGGAVGEPAEHHVGHLAELGRDGGVEHRVPVAVDRRPPRRHPVDHLPTVGEVEPAAGGAADGDAGHRRGHRRVRVPHRGAVAPHEVGRVRGVEATGVEHAHRPSIPATCRVPSAGSEERTGTTTMKHAVWTANGLAVEDVEPPALAEGFVRLRVEACGICGSDLHFWTGQQQPELATVPGHEFVGTVLDAPAGIADGRYAASPIVRCGTCEHCRAGEWNLCRRGGELIGLGRDGGLAEWVDVPAVNLVALERGRRGGGDARRTARRRRARRRPRRPGAHRHRARARRRDDRPARRARGPRHVRRGRDLGPLPAPGGGRRRARADHGRRGGRDGVGQAAPPERGHRDRRRHGDDAGHGDQGRPPRRAGRRARDLRPADRGPVQRPAQGGDDPPLVRLRQP